jgi:putative oxidoreductase
MIGSGLTKYRDVGLLLLRVGLGIAFICHGWPKLAGGAKTWEMLGNAAGTPAPVVMGFIAGLIELGGGLLLALGLFFRPAAALLFLQMLVALFRVHLPHGDPFNTYSHALEDAIVFLSLILIGPGKYSIHKN